MATAEAARPVAVGSTSPAAAADFAKAAVAAGVGARASERISLAEATVEGPHKSQPLREKRRAEAHTVYPSINNQLGSAS